MKTTRNFYYPQLMSNVQDVSKKNDIETKRKNREVNRSLTYHGQEEGPSIEIMYMNVL